MRLPRHPEGMLQIAGHLGWARCSFEGVALVEGGLELAWPLEDTKAPAAGEAERPPPTTGMAFDRCARLFRTVEGTSGDAVQHRGRLEVIHWGADRPQAISAPELPRAFPEGPWDEPGPPAAGLPERPAGLGALAPLPGTPDLLWVCDPEGRRLWRFDTQARRYLGHIELPGEPVDIAACRCAGAVAVVRDEAADGTRSWRLFRVDPCEEPVELPLAAEIAPPSGSTSEARIALTPGGSAFLLVGAGTSEAVLYHLPAPLERGLAETGVAHPQARDVVVAPALDQVPAPEQREPPFRPVLCYAPGMAFWRLNEKGNKDRAMTAPGYDGGLIEPAPDGRVAYFASRRVPPPGLPEAHLRHALPARIPRLRNGRVLSFRLDSEQYRTTWGRVLVEACVAPNTYMYVRTVATDDDEVALLPSPLRQPPGNAQGELAVWRPEETPPPGPAELDRLSVAVRRDFVPRGEGLRGEAGFDPWTRPGTGARWHESWADGRGRYLWVELTLAGDGFRTPRVTRLEVEYPGHGWLRHLPRAFSREEAAADFLRRYLAGPADLFGDLGVAADARHRLLDPSTAPREVLDFLASLLGLAFEPWVPEAARRALIAEAARLARRRGTVEMVRRTTEILAGVPTMLMEAFRLRGPGVVGATDAGGDALGSGVLGAGIVLGGPAPSTGEGAVNGPHSAAWRFTLLVQGELSAEHMDHLRTAVERIKPAHTSFTLCGAASGTRVGVGAHLGVSTVVGPTGGFPPPLVGQIRLSRDSLVGRPLGPVGEEDGGC